MNKKGREEEKEEEKDLNKNIAYENILFFLKEKMVEWDFFFSFITKRM